MDIIGNILRIEKADVYEEVAKATDYIGSKRGAEGGDLRDQILATDDDLWDWGILWEEGVTALNEQLKEDLSGASETSGDVMECVISYRRHRDASLMASIETAAKNYLVDFILSRWLEICGQREESVRRMERVKESGLMLESLLSHRERPTRSE